MVLDQILTFLNWVLYKGLLEERLQLMFPPRVGRLTFQVGSRATQVITIDLGDFGKGGPITNDVTGDVDDTLENMVNRINSRDSAEGVLEGLI